jgi:hypothetical protein
MLLRTLAPCLCALAAIAAGAAQAGAGTADSAGTGSDTVVVTGIRDPALLPYRRGYEFTTKIRAASGGHVRLKLRALSKKSREPIPDLHVHIIGSRDYGEIAISQAGYFEVPLIDAALHDNADFVTNQKKGSMRIDATLNPVLPAGDLRYSDIQQSIAGARHAIAAILPWYLRMWLPTVKGVGICYRQPGATVDVETADGTVERAADKKETDEEGVKLLCARFSASEWSLQADSKLMPDPGYEAIFTGSWL